MLKHVAATILTHQFDSCEPETSRSLGVPILLAVVDRVKAKHLRMLYKISSPG